LTVRTSSYTMTSFLSYVTNL